MCTLMQCCYYWWLHMLSCVVSSRFSVGFRPSDPTRPSSCPSKRTFDIGPKAHVCKTLFFCLLNRLLACFYMCWTLLCRCWYVCMHNCTVRIDAAISPGQHLVNGLLEVWSQPGWSSGQEHNKHLTNYYRLQCHDVISHGTLCVW